MKVKLSLYLHACTFFIALTGLSSGANTTTSYVWANTGGGSETWTGTGSWTVGGVATSNSPGVTQSGSNYDEATITNTGSTATTINTPNSGTLTFDSLTVNPSGSNGNLTIDINSNLTTTHVASTNLNDSFADTSTSSVLIVNVENGATYTSDSEGFTFDAKNSGSQFNILSGGEVLAFTTGNNNATFGMTGSSADTFNVSGTLAEDSTNMTGTGFYAAGTNTSFRLGGSDVNFNSGGVGVLNSIVEAGASGSTGADQLNIAGGTLTVRYGSEGIYFGQNTTANYYNTATEANSSSGGGTVLNNGQLAIGAVDGSANQVSNATKFYQGVTAVSIGNAGTGGSSGNVDTWTQNGMTAIGNGLVGSLTVNPTGVFDAHDVYIGGGTLQSNVSNPSISSYGSTLTSSLTVGSTVYTKLTASGTLVLNGGTVAITNAYAGTSFTTSAAGLSSSAQYFTPSASAGGQPYVGERIEFTSLSGATGSGLSLNTPYYVVYTTKAANTFAVSATPGGAQIATTGTYTAATYETLGSVLDVGSSMYFSGGTSTVIPGTLTLNSGSLSVDELDTNDSTGSAILNGAASPPAAATINFNGGTLIIGASNPNTTTVPNSGALSSLTIGNGGATAALLQFAGGTSSVPQALASNYVLSSNATLGGYGYVSATTTSNGGTISGNGTLGGLTLTGLITISTGSNTLSGSDTANSGVSITGSSTVSQTGTFTGSVNNSSSGTSGFAGVIAGTGNTLTVSAGLIDLSGSSGNTFTGTTSVSGGELDLDKTSVLAIDGTTVNVSGSGLLKLLASNQIATGATVNVTGGTVNFNGQSQTLTSVTNSGGIVIYGGSGGSGTVTVSDPTWQSGGTNEVEGLTTFSDGLIVTGGTNNVYSGSGTQGQLTLGNGAPPSLAFTGSGAPTITIDGDTTLSNKPGIVKLQGNVTADGASTATIATGSGAVSGELDLNGANRTFTVGGTTNPGLLVSAQIVDSVGSGGALTKAGTGTMTVTGASTYGGGTTVSAGTLFVNNASGSGTGSGTVTVNGGTLAGTGNITGTTMTVNTGGTLASGDAQSATSVDGTHLTITSTAVTIATANLTFDLGANNVGGNAGSYHSFASPNTNTTYLSLSGSTVIDFSGTDSVSLVDLTNTTGSNGSLALRLATPYLLISAGSNADYQNLVINSGTPANPIYSLSQNDGGAIPVNGYVVGVYTGSGAVNAADSTPISIAQYESNGSVLLSPGAGGTYPAPVLYLDAGQLEVVPEPGTWALMLGGVALLVVIQRRRRQL